MTLLILWEITSKTSAAKLLDFTEELLLPSTGLNRQLARVQEPFGKCLLTEKIFWRDCFRIFLRQAYLWHAIRGVCLQLAVLACQALWKGVHLNIWNQTHPSRHSSTCFTLQEISSGSTQRILCLWCAAGLVCMCFWNWKLSTFLSSFNFQTTWNWVILRKNLLLISSSDLPVAPKPPKNKQRAWNLEPWLSLNQVIDKVRLAFLINSVMKVKGWILCLSQARCPLNKVFMIISLNPKSFCIFLCLFSMKFLRDFLFFSGGISTGWQVIARLLFNSHLQSVYLWSDELGVCTSTPRFGELKMRKINSDSIQII